MEAYVEHKSARHRPMPPGMVRRAPLTHGLLAQELCYCAPCQLVLVGMRSLCIHMHEAHPPREVGGAGLCLE